MKPVTTIDGPIRLEFEVTAGRTTAAFVRHLLERRLVGRRCPSCAKVYLPPRGACPTCGVPTTEEVDVGPGGTVTTFSVVRFPFEGQRMQPPYACAHILLDGTDTPLLHIVGGVDADQVRMGLRVRPVWSEQPMPTLASVLWFEPSGEPDAPYDSFKEHV